jgi:hypothetical protein
LLVMAGIALFGWIAARPIARDPRSVDALRSDHGA